MTSMIRFERDADRTFPEEPFAIQHGLVGHKLLSLEALSALAGRLPRDRVEYNSGRLAVDQPPDRVPAIDLKPNEIVDQIETADAWMVLKNVEAIPEYRMLIAGFLKDAATELGYDDTTTHAEMEDFQGFVFVASPNAVTPFHLDYEQNFFIHLAGRKFMHVFDNRDRMLVSEPDLEIHPGKHRNLPYHDEFESRAKVFGMSPGDGLFLPYTWPHWVRTGDSTALSMAITWKSRREIRLNSLYFVNAVMRKMRLPQPAPGRLPILDGLKVAAYRLARTAVEPLRRSEPMRRRLRQVFFGAKANYYYRDDPRR